MVLGVGVVAENDTLEDSPQRKGMYGIDEQHLLQSSEAAIVSNTQLEPRPRPCGRGAGSCQAAKGG
jgi:hypothetical protein